MLKLAVLSLVFVGLTGCATNQSTTVMTVKKYHYGYKPYDPCLKCGEQWHQLPNWEHEAIIRRNRGEQW
jgi:hypothetical protein